MRDSKRMTCLWPVLACILGSAGIPAAAAAGGDDFGVRCFPPDAAGYPSRAADLDVLPGFRNPPAGYGEVPFWWWTGDPLNRDRLLWQIEELHKKGIPGMQINYAHEDTSGWPTYAAKPEIFSDAWWDMWRFVADECGKRGMSVGISGYTLDWPGKDSNLFGRLVYSDPELNGQELVVDKKLTVKAGERAKTDVPADLLVARAYRLEGGRPMRGGVDLSEQVRSGKLEWTAPEGTWQIWVFAARRKPLTLNPIHPLSGARIVEKFFQPFEDHAGGSSKGLNYFFQDELNFGVGGLIWTQDFASEFNQRKGYDLLDVMPALFEDMGPITPKVRLDYADVKVQLTEERYFRPIFDWHAKRGLIYACDPGSRGQDPAEFGDYFRCVRWYTAPGHDTPGGSADLIKDKVSSSIAHLYQRPRVWLEGYHSLGWGATPATLMHATRENFLFGCTLLNLHGLYYTTHGSFWEWAPPCYHFRMPYWEHMAVFLRYFDRLSYLLSQGVHRCDVAILYPVAPFDAGMGGDEARGAAFDTGRRLMAAGIDFDFIDFESLGRAELKDGRICVAGEAYRVLVLPAMRAIRWSSLEKAGAFFQSGGVVIAVGALPEASDRAGREDAQLDQAVKDIFGVAAAQARSTPDVAKRTSPAKGTAQVFAKPEQVPLGIAAMVAPDVQSTPLCMALHRRIGSRDVYMVMGAAKGSEVSFQTSGRVELWDPWTGESRPLHAMAQTEGTTRLRMPLEDYEAQVIVFSPDKPTLAVEATDLEEVSEARVSEGKVRVVGYAAKPGPKSARVRVDGQLLTAKGEAPQQLAPIVLDGSWEFELKPTMDNRWGDFRLPATDARIGPEARLFRYAQETSTEPGWERPEVDDSSWERVGCGFGPKFWKLGPLPESTDPAAIDAQLAGMRQIDPKVPVEVGGKKYAWQPYAFSWRWGVEGDPGHQGFHGLKENVTDEFICLGAKGDGHNEIVYVAEPAGKRYYLWTTAATAEDTTVNVLVGDYKPAAAYLNGTRIEDLRGGVTLKSGMNPLLLRYDAPGRGHFVLERVGVSAVKEHTPLAMGWYDRPGVVAFDVRAGDSKPAGWYRFVAPPGLRAMTVTTQTTGRVQAWADGELCSIEKSREPAGGPGLYRVMLDRPKEQAAKVAIRIEQQRGTYGGASLPEPVTLECGPGMANIGDWSAGTALECYSGGAWYRKTVTLNEDQTRGRILLHLGDVAATAEVHVNGRLAGTRVAPPWTVDITGAVKAGENRIEILVYNTLANHYLTVPTRYRGSPRSGLIGPVRIETRVSTVLSGD